MVVMACPCGFKGEQTIFQKTSGYCPACGTKVIEGLEEIHSKPKKTKEELNAMIARSKK